DSGFSLGDCPRRINCLNAQPRRLYSDRAIPSRSTCSVSVPAVGASTMSLPNTPRFSPPPPGHPTTLSATRIFLRGLAITLPPILTLVILIWIVHGINSFVIQLISSAVRFGIAHAVQKERVRPIEGLVKPDGLPGLPHCERNYFVLPATRSQCGR